jgi:5-methylcytosine-specific restriction endonuclease McrA
MQAHPALMLNADFRPLSYFPLSLLSWQDAITAVFKDHVSVVAEYDKWVSSPSTKIRLPSVVALREYIPMPKRVAFTRFNVFLRDRFRCQYCGETLLLRQGSRRSAKKADSQQGSPCTLMRRGHVPSCSSRRMDAVCPEARFLRVR